MKRTNAAAPTKQTETLFSDYLEINAESLIFLKKEGRRKTKHKKKEKTKYILLRREKSKSKNKRKKRHETESIWQITKTKKKKMM